MGMGGRERNGRRDLRMIDMLFHDYGSSNNDCAPMSCGDRPGQEGMLVFWRMCACLDGYYPELAFLEFE
jgi:hypothetical protein